MIALPVCKYESGLFNRLFNNPELSRYTNSDITLSIRYIPLLIFILYLLIKKVYIYQAKQPNIHTAWKVNGKEDT